MVTLGGHHRTQSDAQNARAQSPKTRRVQIRGESGFGGSTPQDVHLGIDRVIGNTPTPEFALEVCEESDRLMSQLPDDSFREVARLKFAGYSNEEITQKTGQSKRTVGRRLNLIRIIWSNDDSVISN